MNKTGKKDPGAFKEADFDADDPNLTLQTCVLNRADLRLIEVAKEVSRTKPADVFQ